MPSSPLLEELFSFLKDLLGRNPVRVRMKREGDLEPGSWPSLSGVTVPVPAVSFSPELVDGFRPWLHHLLLAIIWNTVESSQWPNDETKKRVMRKVFFFKTNTELMVCSVQFTE